MLLFIDKFFGEGDLLGSYFIVSVEGINYYVVYIIKMEIKEVVY